ncbi:hypothetical protein MIND_00445000 [Mycena indigotica]|uniref:Uncharacterized protein n=1 Tax=Mycena indigotica TaxID=2126181 RepID=A0A8H6SYA1_9AGAR|nr:uncharacterized protein MIND_00445000 [Mycena indigotica]KAF7306537.1 hypothetical protein MIND_00445000 [Mycena indigotica]
MLLSSWCFFSLWFLSGWAALVNVTIDDELGDTLTKAQIIYSPIDAWDTRTSCKANSPTCAARPDDTKLVGGTWHESTFSRASSNKHPNVPSTATAAFNGSAVYVFCAIPRTSFAPNGNIQLTFYIDGVQAGQFSRMATSSTGFDYNVPVFVLEQLTSAPHTLTIQNGIQGGADSLMILDSIVYTVDSDHQAQGLNAAKSTKGISSATMAVVGVLVFAVLVMLALLAVFLIRRHRKRRGVYAQYMPKGAVKAYPSFLTPSPASTPRLSPAPSPLFVSSVNAGPVTMPPPAYNGNTSGNWWAGRDQKVAAGIGSQRPYGDLDPSSSNFQRPQGWERSRQRSSS